ncbi:Nucleolar protein 14 [Pyrenophora tritici-repentis]|nr:Nucleolar protein 14 [Pyrenophora tritici-repentis]KAF7446472.1 Nucleolar protein [Pyrenophora tritici-repentis]KAI0573162.1 Nucleolar protein 14 [Pyrenophora tritici-repentis]KAI0580189.1 Nucleolar protein 14 [Pyrenophora tritici-repentis]KAI0605574.1 Nucleolar protein 14 [Pyrenophora tritici-repentis]
MPPSQLKRLKASLREQGITGPQQSKKQKKSQSKNADHHARKASALQSIRESFNPFEFKHLARPHKHEYVSAQAENAPKKILGRPGVTKSQGEEARRKSLLPEMHRKNKVGGILDRRIGEADPTMSVEDRMMARFEQEQSRKRSGNVFDLEDDADEVELTHGGQSLRFDDEIGEEDYDAASVAGSSDDEDGFMKKKRRIDEVDGEAPATEEQPERKKSKQEVMKEVIAKSKQYKYERQAQKEDDDEMRDALDKDLGDVLAALRGHINKKPEPDAPKESQRNDFGMNADRAALLAGTTQQDKDREYDSRVRQLLLDQRAKPTERTKTEEEKAREEAGRLKELEQKRMKRMRGESVSDDEEPQKKGKEADKEEDDMDSLPDDAAEFGLKAPGQLRPEGVEDEDDFIMDDDLVATDSEAEMSDDESEAGSAIDDTMAMDEEDADFLKDVMPERKEQPKAVNGVLTLGAETTSKLAYTYECPRSHEELLKVFKNVAPNDTSTVIQRIRALYHAGLRADNKNKLADFVCALIDHVSYLSNQTPAAPLAVIEAIIRHIHSMARSYPVQIATKFREHLKNLQVSNIPTPGDLALLSAIGSIFPTSDHFHQVVTPAITLMARWMGLTSPASTQDVATGAFIGALCLQYQRLSKRYVPELIRYTTLCLLSPHATPTLLAAHAKNVLTAASTYETSPSFIEIFTPLLPPLKSSKQTPFEESFDPNRHYDPDKERAEAKRLQKDYKRERKGAMRELRKDAHFIARESLREKKEKDRAYENKYRRLVAEIQGEEGRERNGYEREKKARKAGR